MHSIKLLAVIGALSIGMTSALDNNLQTRRKTLRNKRHRNKKNGIDKKDGKVMDEEDVVFWTRLLQERGKEVGGPDGSMPFIPRPPSPVLPPSTTTRPTRRPTRRPSPPAVQPTPPPTRRPQASPTPPAPTPPAFNCPPTSLVGCTAVDPSNPVDECPTVGEPCTGGIEFCCRDGCPRNYCTAKEGPASRRK